MSKQLEWTPDETARLERLFVSGLSAHAMVAFLPGRTATAIYLRAKWLGLKRSDDVDRSGFDLARASLLHLLDLKRAGHSPRRTELSVRASRNPPQMLASGMEYLSCYGSPAAACEEASAG